MSILNKSIHKITFEDIVEICRDGTIESAVLDYKETVPKDLSKHFAAFSNTYGGLIIIGVEEDQKTGKPLKYEGIELESKEIDRIHQFAANVTPLPHYEVKETNEVKGRVFLLIRIYQGDLSPYVSNSDLSIKIRTGNVTTPLRVVESHELNKLFERREKASGFREDAISFSTDILLKEICDAKDKIEQELSTIHPSVLAVTMSDLEEPSYRITIIPQSPGDPIIDYRDTLAKIGEYRFSNGTLGTFPGYNESVVPGGLYSFRYGSNRKFEYGLINENGLIDLVEDITRINSDDGKKTISIMVMVNRLVRQIRVARKFYDLAGYNGLLNIDIRFECPEPLVPYPIIDGGAYWPDESNMATIQSHHWTIKDFDTVILGDDTLLVPKLVELINRVYWHFGFSDDDSELIEGYLAKLGLKTQETEAEE